MYTTLKEKNYAVAFHLNLNPATPSCKDLCCKFALQWLLEISLVETDTGRFAILVERVERSSLDYWGLAEPRNQSLALQHCQSLFQTWSMANRWIAMV